MGAMADPMGDGTGDRGVDVFVAEQEIGHSGPRVSKVRRSESYADLARPSDEVATATLLR